MNPPENSPSEKDGGLPTQKRRFPLSRLEALFGGLILLGLIYLGYVLFFQEDGGSASALERRIKKLEALTQEQAERIDREIKAMQALQTQWENRLKALETQRQTASLPASPAAPGAMSFAQTPTTKSAPPPSATQARSPSPEGKVVAPGSEAKKLSSSDDKKKILHKVKKGETLKSIAARYKVSPRDLLIWNKKGKNKQVRPGETLVILSR